MATDGEHNAVILNVMNIILNGGIQSKRRAAQDDTHILSVNTGIWPPRIEREHVLASVLSQYTYVPGENTY